MIGDPVVSVAFSEVSVILPGKLWGWWLWVHFLLLFCCIIQVVDRVYLLKAAHVIYCRAQSRVSFLPRKSNDLFQLENSQQVFRAVSFSHSNMTGAALLSGNCRKKPCTGSDVDDEDELDLAERRRLCLQRSVSLTSFRIKFDDFIN